MSAITITPRLMQLTISVPGAPSLTIAGEAMSSLAERIAADYRLGVTPYRRATVTASERIQLPSGCGPGDGHIEFTADGSDVWIRFGDSAVEVSASAVSTVDGSGAVTSAGATVPHVHIPAGQSRSPKLPAGCTHFAHISENTTGFLSWVPATGQGAVSA